MRLKMDFKLIQLSMSGTFMALPPPPLNILKVDAAL